MVRFLSSEVDLLGRLTARSFTSLESSGRSAEMLLVDTGSSLEYNFVFLNLNRSVPAAVARKQKWFVDKRFRQALSMAIDRESIVRLVYSSRAAPLWSHVPPGNRQWAADLPKPPRSVGVAKDLLRSAGFSWNSAGKLVDPGGAAVAFSILVSQSAPDRRQMAAILSSDWRELGIAVQVAALEFRVVLDRVLQTKDYEACLLGLGGGDADPNPEMNVWLSSGSMHLWSPLQKIPMTPWEAKIDGLMKRQMITLDVEKRRKLYYEAQKTIAEELPVISLASPNILAAARRGLGNFRPAILDSYTLWNAEHLYWTERRR
jgi:peptide/nickel transport system substrate-binding protein